jgi:hypothetical protein
MAKEKGETKKRERQRKGRDKEKGETKKRERQRKGKDKEKGETKKKERQRQWPKKKDKIRNNDQQNITQKTKDSSTRASFDTAMNSGAS